MKKLILTLSFIVIGGASHELVAQDAMDVYRAVFQIEKKDALSNLLKLNPEEGTTFWPIYTEYESARTELADQRIAIINRYAEEYDGLSDETADELAKETLALNRDRMKLLRKYYKKAKREIGGKKAASCVQFELYVMNSIGVEIGNNLPFIGELD
jgi:hypothetical protein